MKNPKTYTSKDLRKYAAELVGNAILRTRKELRLELEAALTTEINLGADRRRSLKSQAGSMALMALRMKGAKAKEADCAACEQAALQFDARRDEMTNALQTLGRLFTHYTGRDFIDTHEQAAIGPAPDRST